MSRVYLDWNATAPLRPEARAAMIAAMDVLGNPSSVHAEGRAAKGLIETARGQVADLVGCEASEIVFTSGATEAAAMAQPDLATVSTSAVEHDCVFVWNNSLGGACVIDVGPDGAIRPTISSPGKPSQSFADGMWDDMVAVQSANSETGVVHDLVPVIAAIRETKRGTTVLMDIVQELGKMPSRYPALLPEFALVSGHKFGAAKGVGALVVGAGREIGQRLRGGGQEMGRRSGTENVIGIAGFGAAAEAARRDLADGVWERVAALRNILEEALEAAAEDLIIFGRGVPRLANTSCFAIPGWKGETQVMQMDLAGYAVSAGSACSSGKVKESRVLRAMGFDGEVASSAIRVSLGPATTKEEILGFVQAWTTAYRRFKARAA
ncbi:cysteine desulfurase family protein [Algicella marina]|uniref:Cysteine desulfurase n=1 Tax=Algicella marina TaxID=2683284 RepID=A0A6P1SZC8_9RHOB|nr:aminotransferase class V-fold PLP-dependent enzyme [Algicella marina]QHQ34821.1 aminotransferase class V-fold PLP-dependent enzyme [Algicella marina]